MLDSLMDWTVVVELLRCRTRLAARVVQARRAGVPWWGFGSHGTLWK
jgi:hypothetical protein